MSIFLQVVQRLEVHLVSTMGVVGRISGFARKLLIRNVLSWIWGRRNFSNYLGFIHLSCILIDRWWETHWWRSWVWKWRLESLHEEVNMVNKLFVIYKFPSKGNDLKREGSIHFVTSVKHWKNLNPTWRTEPQI